VTGLLDEVLGLGATFDVSVYDLSFRARHPAARGAHAADLPRARGGHRGHRSLLRPSASSARSGRRPRILARFDERRAALLKRLFKLARQGKTWFSLDLTEAVRTLDEPRERIAAALNYLEEQGDVVLQLTGLRQGYRRTDREGEADADRLRELLVGRFLERERRDIAQGAPGASTTRGPTRA